MAKEIWRDYVVRKYVRARSAAEALKLSESLPVIEVNEMKENPATSNGDHVATSAVGFYAGCGEEADGLRRKQCSMRRKGW
jgi:hypothetical protein